MTLRSDRWYENGVRGSHVINLAFFFLISFHFLSVFRIKIICHMAMARAAVLLTEICGNLGK